MVPIILYYYHYDILYSIVCFFIILHNIDFIIVVVQTSTINLVFKMYL